MMGSPGRTDTELYRPSEKSIPKIAKELGIAYESLRMADPPAPDRRRRARGTHHRGAGGVEQAAPGEQDPKAGKRVPEKSGRLLRGTEFPTRQAAKSAIFEYLGPSTTPAGCTRHWATGAPPISRRVEWETLRSHKVNVSVLPGDSRPRPFSGVGFRCRSVFEGSPLIVLANSLNNSPYARRGSSSAS
jgi:hypothetical protein